MRLEERTIQESSHRGIDASISRRVAIGSSSIAVLSLLAGSTLGQEEKKEPQRKEAETKPRGDRRDRMEEFKDFSERMRNASPEERMKIMEEQRVRQHQRAIEDLKEQLKVSDKEWPVIKPRIEKVYNLVHPMPQMRMGAERPRSEVERRSSELRELLRKDGAPVDQIKAGLAALRAAKAKEAQELATARQDLRQLVTLAQEAELVLSGLLD